MSIYEIMLNQTRMRIVQIISNKQKATTNEICEILFDVPRATIYRHISILIEADIISVVDEKKVRGSVERTLSLNMAELSKQNNSENIPQQAFQFFMSIYAKFEKYFSNKNRNEPAKFFFNNTVMMMSNEEFDAFLSELQSLFVKYHFEMADGRKPRDITIISAPPEGIKNGRK